MVGKLNMRSLEEKGYKASGESQYEHLIDKLPVKSKIMLNLVKDHPGINAKTIQQELNLESKHTFLKYMRLLLNNGLIEFQKGEKDKRHKQFQLTTKGHTIQHLILENELEDSLNCFFKYCESIFLNFYPEYVDSVEWMKFKKSIGYVDHLVESLEKQVLSYIKTSLENKNDFKREK
jgi:predicted transcriptional regulator